MTHRVRMMMRDLRLTLTMPMQRATGQIRRSGDHDGGQTGPQPEMADNVSLLLSCQRATDTSDPYNPSAAANEYRHPRQGTTELLRPWGANLKSGVTLTPMLTLVVWGPRSWRSKIVGRLSL
jgi:hypothetical protein